MPSSIFLDAFSLVVVAASSVVGVVDSGTRMALDMLALRALPAVVVLAATWPVGAGQRALLVLGYTCFATAAGWLGHFNGFAVVTWYVAIIIASGIHYAITRRTRSRWLLFISACGAFLFLPLVLPPGLRGRTFATLAWEACLAAYSWSVDVAETTLSDYLFFVVVNPSMVWTRRGRSIGPAGISEHGFRRIAVGAMGFIAAAGAAEAGSFIVGQTVVESACQNALRMAGVYWSHTGLASMRIGIFRFLGYAVPEAYVSPIRAWNPGDFWRRWNTYVGQWARRYVWRPLHDLLRSPDGKTPRNRTVVAFVVTTAGFAAVGALHDLYRLASEGRISAHGTTWFALNGVIVVAWHAAATPPPSRPYLRLASRLALWTVAVLLVGYL